MKDKFLGFTHDHSIDRPDKLYLKAYERLRTHMLVVGSPGSGKSKFLEWLIRDDIENRQGLCLIDIHGALYENVKRWLSYNYFLTRDVILLDPSAGEHVQGFNPFRPKPGVDVDVQVAGMVQALLRVWGAENTNETPTLDRVLRLVFTAMVVRQIPLHDVFQLVNFDQQELREDVISYFCEPVVRAAWQELQTVKNRGQWRDEVLSTQNRLFRLVQSKTIQRFMGVADTAFNLDLLDIMNQGKILLVNLKESGNLTEENAKAFAALLLNDFFKSAIMFRDTERLGWKPKPFYVYLDEWQNIVTPDIKKILAQARKFGLLLTLANQDLSQIADAFNPNFVNTLMTCCQVKACFGGLNQTDAKRMVQEMMSSQLDLNETKYEVTSTKFWPKYARDNVFTYSRSTTESDSHTTANTEATSTGNGTSNGRSTQQMWTPEGWVSSPESLSTSENTGLASSQSAMEGWTHATSVSNGEGVADIPILIPEPFEEVTSRTTYTLEEQVLRASAWLMEQSPRNCFIKLAGRKTMPMQVPSVHEYVVDEQTVTDYEGEIAILNRAIQPEEVDRLLAAQHSRFLLEGDLEQTELRDEDLYE